MMSGVKAWIDRNLNHLISKKLLVYVTSTVLLCFDKIQPEQFMEVTVAYLGVQGVADMIVKLRSK